MRFKRRRFARLGAIISALHSMPARAIFEGLKGGGLAYGDEVAQYLALVEIIHAELDELEGTRPGLDEPDLWWETDWIPNERGLADYSFGKLLAYGDASAIPKLG